jgi:hypothetical protein
MVSRRATEKEIFDLAYLILFGPGVRTGRHFFSRGHERERFPPKIGCNRAAEGA